MIEKMNLSQIERWAIHILTKSQHIGLLVVKEYMTDLVYVVRDVTDEVPLPNFGNEPEPPSMTFERMYHAPSFGERE